MKLGEKIKQLRGATLINKFRITATVLISNKDI